LLATLANKHFKYPVGHRLRNCAWIGSEWVWCCRSICWNYIRYSSVFPAANSAADRRRILVQVRRNNCVLRRLVLRVRFI